ncbi:MAG: hypothetical protein ACYC6T_10180 [Thermoleophilia bacterium]
MVEMVVKVMFALLAVALVAYPLLAPPRDEEEDLDAPEDLVELHHRRESTYSAIKELEFDFRTGKLSEEDFRELDVRYRTDALELMDAIEEWGEDGGGAALEAHDAEAEPLIEDGDAEALCGECGAVVSPAHRFCASCGAEAVA